MLTEKDVTLAWALAEKYHGGQMYEDQLYTKHLKAVEAACQHDYSSAQPIYQASGAKEPFEEWFRGVRIVAILHDVLEDTKLQPEVLLMLFPAWVANAVDALTKCTGQDDNLYMLRVRANPVAKFVKVRDAQCNMMACLARGDSKRAAKYARKMADLMEF